LLHSFSSYPLLSRGLPLSTPWSTSPRDGRRAPATIPAAVVSLR
jgi:hypothetical protein